MRTEKRYRKGILFGVFDLLHEGHKHAITEAIALCGCLVVVVTPDEIVYSLKKKRPHYRLDKRIRDIQVFSPEARVVPGDSELGSWEVMRVYQPDVVCLGYDQQGIEGEMKKLEYECVFLSPHKPEKYHTSKLLNTE